MFIIWRQQKESVYSYIQWPVEKTHKGVWDSSLDYDRLEKKLWMLVMMMFLENLTSFGVSKTSFVTRNNSVVTWKARPRMSIIS